ncbi:MAG: hypothetical protein Q4G45_04790 [Actinomycetia bacterium]|nr:hypothetical protein [Actinomycetes bacterium]
MKVLKGILAALGVIALIVAIVMLIRISWNLQGILGSANRYAPDGGQQWGNPVQDVILSSGVALLSGLLLGIGLGLPRRTSKTVREEAVATYQRTAEPLPAPAETPQQPSLIDKPTTNP